MALKNWKRKTSGKRYISYTKGKRQVEIFKQTPNQTYWEVRRWKGDIRLDKPNREFKTKQQAIRWAKSWMKFH